MAFYLAFIVGAVVGIILIIKKKVKKLSPIPFGPFLILGMVVAYFWGEKKRAISQKDHQRWNDGT